MLWSGKIVGKGRLCWIEVIKQKEFFQKMRLKEI